MAKPYRRSHPRSQEPAFTAKAGVCWPEGRFTAASQAVLISLFLLLMPAPARCSTGADIVRATLNNGLRVVIVRNTLAPVVTTEMNYLAGSNEAPEGFPGMAHAQEHMMFRGSPGLSSEQLSRIIAAMGGEFNADTQQTVTQYFFTVPSDDLDIALHVEAVRMQGVLDDDEMWAKERGAMAQEVDMDLSNPEYVFYSELLKTMFAGTPYAYDALGTKSSFNKTTGAMLKEFYKRWYAPNNAILVIVGNIDPDLTLRKVRELFEAIPPHPVPPRPHIGLRPLEASHITLKTDLPVGLAILAYRLPGYGSPDYAAGQILADVLESRRGILYAMVPEGKALSFDFSGYAFPGAGFGYAAAAFPRGADGSKLLSGMKEIISGYLRTGFPPEIVEAAKRREIADAEFRKNSVEGLADLWSETVAVEGSNSPEDDIEAFSRVTVEDVNRVAKQYLLSEKAVTGLLTPGGSGKESAAKSFRGKESFAPGRTKEIKLPKWAARVGSLPEVPVSGVRPVIINFPNGLRLIVQSEKVSRTVTIYGKVKNSPYLEEPRGKEGVDQVLDDLFSHGTETLDRLAFQEALDEIAADLSAGTDFSLRVLGESFGRAVELLSDNLLHPALPDEAFTVVREETADSLAGEIDSPSYLASMALRKGLYPEGDPVLRHATPATVRSLGVSDVRDYYRKVFRPDLTTIVVVGNITPDKARAVIGKYFGDWEAKGPRPETELPPAPLNKASATAVHDASRVQDEVTLAQTLGLTRSHPDYYTLRVGQHILAGAFYATRLYRDLREKRGIVYSVEAFLDAGKTRTVFGVEYGSDPNNVSRARSIALGDLRDMQVSQVTSQELRQAKTLLVRQIPLSQSSVDGIAEQLLGLAVEDLALDEPVRAAARYLAVTAPEVKAAFGRWIRPADFVEITIGPAPK